jgi:enamine deaminase RidA (YjgF/YER057c/UK114 family)
VTASPDGGPAPGSEAPIESWTFPPGLGVPRPAGSYAHVTALGSTLYVTGQLPVDPSTDRLIDGDITAQTDQVMSNLARVLELTGSSLPLVVQARSFLRFADDFPAYDEAYRAWFPLRLPSRTTVVVSGFAIPDALVEIDLVAHRLSPR